MKNFTITLCKVFLCILASVSLTLIIVSNASATSFLADDVFATPGGTAQFTVSLDADQEDIQGLSFSVAILGSETYVPNMAVTSASDHPALTADFSLTQAATYSGGTAYIGGVGGYVFDFDSVLTFPTGLTGLGIFEVSIPSTVPLETVFGIVFLDGMQGGGTPISNALTISGSCFELNQFEHGSITVVEQAPVPIPGAVWLLGSGLVGIVGIRRKLDN